MSQTSVMSGTDLSRRPHRVSRNLFEDHQVINKVIIDAGCGSDISLARYLYERGAIYIGIDNDPRALEMMSFYAASAGFREGIKLVSEDIRAAQGRYADYVHLRFVLSLMSFAEREAVVKRFATLAKNGVFVLEYDWNSFMRSASHELAKEFLDILLKYSTDTKGGLCYGAYVSKDISSWLPPYVEITEDRDKAEPADIRPFLNLHLQQILHYYKQPARWTSETEPLVSKIIDLRLAIRKTPFECVPPDIVIVRVFTHPPTL